MQYRTSFIMQTVSHFLVTGVEFIAIWALFSRFGSLKGWILAEVALFYSLISIAFSINDSITRGFDVIGNLIKRGEFDRVLLRPRSTVLQLMGYEFTMKRIGRFSQGVIILIWALRTLQIQWTLGKALLMFGSVAGASCLFMGLLIIQSTIAFWTIESLEIMNSLTYGGVYTAQYPMTIYLPWFRKFFTFVVPLACVNYFPVLAIIEKEDSLGSPVWLQHITPLAGVLFLAAGLLFWRIGMRHYSSTGS